MKCREMLFKEISNGQIFLYNYYYYLCGRFSRYIIKTITSIYKFMKKHFKFLSLAALVVAATLSACQKQDMDLSEEGEVLAEETRASSTFTPYYGVAKWDEHDLWSNSASDGPILGMKVSSTTNYLYLLLMIDANNQKLKERLKNPHKLDYYLWVFLRDDAKGSETSEWYRKTSSVYAMRGWLFQNGKAAFKPVNKYVKYAPKVQLVNGVYYYEIAYPRKDNCPSDLLKKDELHIGVKVESSYCKNSDGSDATRVKTPRSYVPATLDSKTNKHLMYWLDMSGTASTSNTTTTTDPNHCSNIGKTPMVVGYVRLSKYDEGNDYSQMTHIIAYNAVPVSTSNHNIQIKADDDSERKTKEKNLKKLVGNKASGQKVLLLVGGDGAKGFKEIATGGDDAIETFCSSCASFVSSYGLDGIDLDWEHPSSSSDTEKNGLNTIVKKLRNKLGDGKIISLSVSCNPNHYNLKGLLEYADFLNVMTYDLNWRKPYVYHHSALYPSKSNYTTNDVGNSCSSSLNAYLSAIGDKTENRKRLNMGVAFYGRGTSKYDSGDSVHFNEYTDKYSFEWDSDSMVPYMKDSNGGFFGCENERSVNIKGQYANLNGLLGVMFWEYSYDSESKLLKALYNGIQGKDEDGKKSKLTENDLPL